MNWTANAAATASGPAENGSCPVNRTAVRIPRNVNLARPSSAVVLRWSWVSVARNPAPKRNGVCAVPRSAQSPCEVRSSMSR